jgi:hypothetical protein
MLTQDEQELIVSALAFASSADVCANWTEEQTEAMCDLACRLREEYEIHELENLELAYVDEEDIENRAESPEIAKKLIDFIPLG